MKTTIITLLGALALATATPTNLHEREALRNGIYICDNRDWTGNCMLFDPKPGLVGTTSPCWTIPWAHAEVISFGPDEGLVCRLSTADADHCGDATWVGIEYPGHAAVAGPKYKGEGPSYKSFICFQRLTRSG
jgi:hypothetical protein